MSVKQFVKPAKEIENPKSIIENPKSIDVEELLTWSDEKITQFNSEYLPCWGSYETEDQDYLDEGQFILTKIERGREDRGQDPNTIALSGVRFTANGRFKLHNAWRRDTLKVGKILLVPDPRAYSLILDDLKDINEREGGNYFYDSR